MLFLIVLGLASPSFAWAQEEGDEYPVFSGKNSNTVNLFPVARDEAELEPVSQPGRVSLGLALNSLYPMGEPFAVTVRNKATRSLDFQVTTGVSLELGYSVSPKFELGLSAGYEAYSAQLDLANNGGDIVNTPLINRTKLRQFPILLIGRYKLKNLGFSPEFEAGAGMGLGKISVSSSDLNTKGVSESMNSLRGYGAAGAGFSWQDGTSLHMHLGYAYNRLGSGEYPIKSGTVTNSVITQTSMSGIYFKGMMRFNF